MDEEFWRQAGVDLEMHDFIDRLRTWSSSGDAAVPLYCDFAGPPTAEERQATLDGGYPADAVRFWSVCREAWLFVEPRLWGVGLHVLTPVAAWNLLHEMRSGDSDLRETDRLVAVDLNGGSALMWEQGPHDGYFWYNPYDAREDWSRLGPSLTAIVNGIAENDGKYYWRW